jgi:UDP-glucose 4-epimerase
LNQLLNILKDIFGSKISIDYQEPRQGDIRRSLADIGKGKQFLNYDPKVEIEVGLEKTVAYFLKRRMGEEKE